MFALKFVVLVLVPLAATENYLACPGVIHRADWGAKPSLGITMLSVNPPPIVVVHHSDTPSCESYIDCKQRIRNIQEYHMSSRGWDDVGYNFLIGGEGTIFEGRGWGLTGAHTKGWNARSIGICLVGTFQDKYPTAAQLMALESLIECGVENNRIDAHYQLIGHRQAGTTKCPGDKLFKILKNMEHFSPKPK